MTRALALAFVGLMTGSVLIISSFPRLNPAPLARRLRAYVPGGAGERIPRGVSICPECGEAAAQNHVGIVSGIDGAGGDEGSLETGWDVVQPVDAGNFLDQIDVALEVAAE